MAHYVKCFYCGHQFDRDKIKPVLVQNNRRFAHKECYEQAVKQQEEEQADKVALENYIKKLFNYDKLPKRVENQIKEFVSPKYNYSYSGILKTLKYFFDIKGNTTEKANGGIGIVPFVYDDAFRYWYNLWEIQERNKNIEIPDMPIVEIHISPPKRQPVKHIRDLFKFLEEEDSYA